MPTPQGLDRQYLNLQTIQRLARFSFVPRRFLEGHYAGRHASPQRGQSVEFRDFRQYTPGDDVSHVDWKVYGRTDKLYVRMFEHETELCVTLLVDASSSMDYGTRPDERKYDHACRLAASMAFVIMQARDRAGFALARNGLQDYQRPSAAMSQLLQMLDTMQNYRPLGSAVLHTALKQLADKLRRGEILIVLSDLWEDLESFFRAVAQLNHVGAEVILFHVLHQDELRLPGWNDVVLMDSESFQRLPVSVDDVRADYQRRLQQHLAQVQSRCRQFDVQYQFAPMTEPFERTLERYLVRRCTP
jgi:uncharacterized protein (DUF58 family)